MAKTLKPVSAGNAAHENIQNIADDALLRLRAKLDVEIRRRGLRFSVGEVGESLVIAHFNATRNLPKLLTAPRGTKNVDALSREGDRYSIKTALDAKKTGTIYPDPVNRDKQLFEHLLIVRLNSELSLDAIYRLSWDQFLRVRQWDTRMNAWYVGITKKSLSIGECIFNACLPSNIPDEQREMQTTTEYPSRPRSVAGKVESP